MQYIAVKTLKDNYSWIIFNNNKEAIVIDCGELQPLINAINLYQLKVKYILITHYHLDHIYAVTQLQEFTKAQVVGFGKFKNLLPKLDIEFNLENNSIPNLNLLNCSITPIYTPGHSHDHIVYHFNNSNWLFCGDLLFNFGAGKIFTGTPEELLASLNIVSKLPLHTELFFGHEYSIANFQFAKSLEYFNFNHLNINNIVSEHTTLQFQMLYNPFLNCFNKDFAKFLLKTTQLEDNFSVSVHNLLRFKKAKFIVSL